MSLIAGCHARRRRLCLAVGLFIACASVATSQAAADEAVPPQPSNGHGGKVGTFKDGAIKVGKRNRLFRIVVPDSIKAGKPVPLVFAFHGLGDSKDIMPWYSALPKLAKQHGFILVFPNGRNRHWPLVLDWAKPDLAFFDVLYRRITAKYNVDLNRVYLTGMSNGAYFSHLVASRFPARIAAIAAHSGGPGLLVFKGVEVSNKYAVLLVHGLRDGIVKPIESRRARDMYSKAGHPVELVEVEKLGHFWAHNVKINERIARFFAANPRRVKATKEGQP